MKTLNLAGSRLARLLACVLAGALAACASPSDAPERLPESASPRDVAAAADRLAHRARTLDHAGQPDAALRQLDQALALQPAHLQARVDRAWLHLRAGRTAMALADSDRAVLFGPNDASARTSRCVIQVAAERNDAGLKHCQHALLNPANETVGHMALGQALLVLGRHREARTAFERALAAEPGHMPALYGRGSARLQAGDPEGQHDLDEAVRQSPASAHALMGVAN